jgi:hypothetical protein
LVLESIDVRLFIKVSKCRDEQAMPIVLRGVTLLLFVYVISLGAIVSIKTQSVVTSMPFGFAALGILRLMRWVLFWFSTQAERRAFSPERETLIGALRTWFEYRSP